MNNIDDNGNLLPGYRAYNGYIFTQSDCDRYNAHNARIARAQGDERMRQELNSRHLTFCLITGCNGPNP